MGVIVPCCLIKECLDDLRPCHCRNLSWFSTESSLIKGGILGLISMNELDIADRPQIYI